MNADEIRKMLDCPETELNFKRVSLWTLVEIAAQLAELNTHARKLAAVVKLDQLGEDDKRESGHLCTDYYAPD